VLDLFVIQLLICLLNALLLVLDSVLHVLVETIIFSSSSCGRMQVFHVVTRGRIERLPVL